MAYTFQRLHGNCPTGPRKSYYLVLLPLPSAEQCTHDLIHSHRAPGGLRRGWGLLTLSPKEEREAQRGMSACSRSHSQLAG